MAEDDLKLKTYLVIRVEEVVVTATKPEYAEDLAVRVFTKTKKMTDQLNVVEWPKQTGVIVKKIPD